MQKTILIVDDDNNLRVFLSKVLIANNFKVAEAKDGAEALEAVEKYFPDLVLLDFVLPKVPGETVCVKIKQDHPNIIVIVLTEKNSSSDVVHGLQIGADDYLSKPFVAEELIARIDTRLKTAANGHVVNGESEPAQNKALQNEKNEPEKIILRESIVLVIIRIVFTEVVLVLFSILLSILFSYLSSYTNVSYPANLHVLLLASAFLINIIIVIFIALKWNSEYTEVSKEGVIKHSGILHRKEQKYACNFVEASKFEQSFLGMLLNYGTIELYDPALKEQVYLLNITDPKKYSKIIESIVSKEQEKSMPFLVSEEKQE